MPTYTYCGLHPREGAVPVHTFYSCDGSKPVVAMKSSIVIDGQSLQKVLPKEATFMLNAFQHFSITDIYTTNQDYDYALLVENLENDSVPDKLVDCVLMPDASYMGIIIDHNPRDGSYTVGCGPRVFTKVYSNFSCTDPSSEFPSVHLQTCIKSITCGNISDYEADITCMADCISQALPPDSSCHNMHNERHCTSPAAMMPPCKNETPVEISQFKQNHCTAKHPSNCEASASSACSLRDEPLIQGAEANFPFEYSCRPKISAAKNESPEQTDNDSSTLMSLEDFETYKPTVSSFEKRFKTLIDEEHTVTI